MKLNQFSRRSMRSIRKTQTFVPNSLTIELGHDYQRNRIRWQYRKLRSLGVDEYNARSVIWDSMWAASMYDVERKLGFNEKEDN